MKVILRMRPASPSGVRVVDPPPRGTQKITSHGDLQTGARRYEKKGRLEENKKKEKRRKRNKK